jgi:hypothetical protein
MHEMMSYPDFSYFSGRKVSCTRGGGICTNDHKIYMQMRDLVPLFEGFLTYGGMSVREIEAMAVGLYETLDFNVISHSPTFIKYLVDSLDNRLESNSSFSPPMLRSPSYRPQSYARSLAWEGMFPPSFLPRFSTGSGEDSERFSPRQIASPVAILSRGGREGVNRTCAQKGVGCLSSTFLQTNDLIRSETCELP